MRKILTSFLAISIVLSLCGMNAYAKTTKIDVPQDYATIQDAVDHANDGDIIFVSAGTYFGQVIVAKKISIIGESAESTFLQVNHDESGFIVIANDVSISGFTVSGATDFQEAGILIGGEFPGDERYVSIGYVTISKCVVEYNCNGIYIWKAHDCMIVNNVARYNDAVTALPGQRGYGGLGMIAWEGPSTNNSFVNNEIYYNFRWGLFVGGDTYTSYDGTKIHGNMLYRNGARWDLAPGDNNFLGIGIYNADGKIMVSGNRIYPVNLGQANTEVWVYNSPDTVAVGNPVYKAKGPHVPIPPGG